MAKAVKEWSEYDSLFRGSFLSYLVGLYIFAHYLELALRMPALDAIRFHFVFGLIVAVFAVPRVMKSRLSEPSGRSLVRTACWLIFILGVYTLFSMDRDTSTTLYSDRVVKFAMMSVFIVAAVEKVDDLRVVVFIALLAWLKMGLEGFMGVVTGSLVWENQGIPRLHGASPSIGHPNSFSGFGVGCLPFCFYLFPAVRSYLIKLFLLVLLIFAVLIIVQTGSRTGYVAALGGGIVYFYNLKVKFFKKIFLVAALAMAAVTFLPQAYQERFESIFTGKEKEGASAETRKEIIVDAIEVFKTYPFGVGVGAFPKVRNDLFSRIQDTHNLYLQILTNISIPGLIVFLMFVIKMMRLNIRNLRTIAQMRPVDVEAQWNYRFLSSVASATIGFLLLRLILGLFGMDMYEIYWWLALGLTLAVNKLLYLERAATAPAR